MKTSWVIKAAFLLAGVAGLAACNKTVVAADTLNAADDTPASNVAEPDISAAAGLFRPSAPGNELDYRGATARSGDAAIIHVFNGEDGDAGQPIRADQPLTPPEADPTPR